MTQKLQLKTSETMEVWRMIDQDTGDVCGVYLTNDANGLSKCMEDAEAAVFTDPESEEAVAKELEWSYDDIEDKGVMETFGALAKKRKITCVEVGVVDYLF